MTIVGLSVVSMLLTNGPRFEEVTVAAGVPSALAATPTVPFGAPAAWLDWDGDPYPDLLVGEPAGPTRLFLNHGSLPFVEATPPELKALPNLSSITPFRMPPAPGERAPRPALLLVQAKTAADPSTTVDPTSLQAGAVHVLLLPPPGGSGALQTVPIGRPSTHLALGTSGDTDGDGVADLIVASTACGAGAAGVRTVFRLELDAMGFCLSDEDPVLAPGCTPVPMVTDFDDNGRPVLMVATDYGTLETPSLIHRPLTPDQALPGVYGMGIAAGDVDEDGGLDYVVTSIGPDLVLRLGPSRRPEDILSRATEWGEVGRRFKWGLAFLDVDNDGSEELWLTAGGLGGSPDVTDDESLVLVPEPNARDTLLSHGQDVAPAAGLDELTSKRGVAVADIDGDGRLDALVTGMDYRRLYRNVSESPGHWVSFRVPEHPGARFTLEACGRVQRRETSGQQGTAVSQRLVHFGLGDCAGPVELTVSWPWLGVATPQTFVVDQQHLLDDPGTVWVEQTDVEPGAPVRVHSTLPGATRVDGVVLGEDGATLEAPAKPGVYRLSVHWNDQLIDLSPKLRVKAAGPRVLTDPHPIRLGARFQLVASTGPVTLGSAVTEVGEALVATESAFSLRVGDESLPLYAVDNVSPQSRSVSVDVAGGASEIRVALLDAVGSPSADVGSSLELLQLGASVATFERRAAPWYRTRLSEPYVAAQVAISKQPVMPLTPRDDTSNSIDVERSRLWVVTPLVRADGQAVIQVVLIPRNANGRLVVPGPETLPSAQGCTLLNSAWIPVNAGLDTAGYTARLRVGTTAGPIVIGAGGLSGLAWAVESDQPQPTAASTMDLVNGDSRLVPRDVLGQRLGSGVVTDPPFEHRGNGVYHAKGVVRTVRMGNLVGTFDGDRVVWAGGYDAPPAVPNTSSGCGMGPASTSAVWLLLLALAVMRMSRGKTGVPAPAPARPRSPRRTHRRT